MSASSHAKAFRVTFEVTQRRTVDVLAVADWQAIEIARTLHDMCSNAIQAGDDYPEAGGWSVEPLTIGGGL